MFFWFGFCFFYVKSVDHPVIIIIKKIDKEMVSRKMSTEQKGLLKWNMALVKCTLRAASM